MHEVGGRDSLPSLQPQQTQLLFPQVRQDFVKKSHLLSVLTWRELIEERRQTQLQTQRGASWSPSCKTDNLAEIHNLTKLEQLLLLSNDSDIHLGQ